MKPKEFDELIRQKFDQNDFAYKSGSWDSLAEKLEGRAKKRSIMVWWWVPLAGMAASVALAMGSTALLQHGGVPVSNSAKTEFAQTYRSVQPVANGDHQVTIAPSSHKEVAYAFAGNNKKANNQQDKNISDWFHVRLNEVSLKSNDKAGTGFNFLAGNNNVVKPKDKKEKVVENPGYNTFRPEEETVTKIPTLSITLLGGYNSGNASTGYIAGATIRKMISDKLYIESDVACASSSNSQSIAHANYVPNAAVNTSSARHMGAKSSAPPDADRTTNNNAPTGHLETETIQSNYNLYYAQVSPGIGYKVIKRIAIGLGPDFQQMLVDNRPTVTNNVDRGNILVAPTFDVGFVGKSEFMLTKRMKAAVSYRKGINNILTPMDKYIDRDYLQFQLRCTIFNK